MGLVDRFERKLESTLGDTFARVFGGSIVPQEVETILQREAGAGARDVGGGRILAPNHYVITLSASDFHKVRTDPDLTPRLLPDTWRDSSVTKGGKRMVMWSSDSNRHRTCTPASFAPVERSTQTRPAAKPPLHLQTVRKPQNQEFHQ